MQLNSIQSYCNIKLICWHANVFWSCCQSHFHYNAPLLLLAKLQWCIMFGPSNCSQPRITYIETCEALPKPLIIYLSGSSLTLSCEIEKHIWILKPIYFSFDLAGHSAAKRPDSRNFKVWMFQWYYPEAKDYLSIEVRNFQGELLT